MKENDYLKQQSQPSLAEFIFIIFTLLLLSFPLLKQLNFKLQTTFYISPINYLVLLFLVYLVFRLYRKQNLSCFEGEKIFDSFYIKSVFKVMGTLLLVFTSWTI
jgi:uncharacterized membrane protein